MKELLDYSEKSAENRKLAQQILTQDYSDIAPISIEQLWTRCPEDYFVRNTPKQIAWHTSLLVDFVEALLVKISNRFSLGGTEVFIYCQDQPHLFNKVVSTIGAKNSVSTMHRLLRHKMVMFLIALSSQNLTENWLNLIVAEN